jgi:hypothetical protein
LKKIAAAGEPTTFLTLTVNPTFGTSPEDRARHLVSAFRTMLKRASRKFTKQPLHYLAVFERTKKGEPHLHVLMRAPYIPQAWISETMAALINAPIVDIRKVHNRAVAAAYIAKYVSKGPQQFATLKRYWMTRGYHLTKVKRSKDADEWSSGWRVVRQSLYLLAEHWETFGHSVIWHDATTIYCLASTGPPSRDGPT